MTSEKTKMWVSDPFALLDKNHIHELWPKEGTSIESKLNAGSRLVIILSILGYLFTMNINFFIIGFITLAVIGGLYTVNSGTSRIGNAGVSENTDESMSPLKKKEGFSSNRSPSDFENPKPRESYGRDRNNVPISGTFVSPNKSNPLMNVLLPEIQDNPDRGGAMPAFVPKVEENINETAKQFISTNFDASKRDLISSSGANESDERESRDIYNKLFSNLGDNFEFDQSMRNFYATANTRVNNDQRAFAEFCYGDMVSCKEGDEFACSRNSTRIGQVVGA
jgi:hypothetical protein